MNRTFRSMDEMETDSDERVAEDRCGDVTDPHACETGDTHVGEEY